MTQEGGEGQPSPLFRFTSIDRFCVPSEQSDMANPQRMTVDEFERLRPRLGRVSPASVAIARAVLVDGLTLSEAGQRNGLTRQRVHGIVKRFQIAAELVPPNWKRVEVWLPPALAAEVEEMAQKARDVLGDSDAEVVR